MTEKEEKPFEGFVNVTIYDVPAELLREFGKKVIESFYTGGISEAVKDLIRRAVEEKQLQTQFEKFPWREDDGLFNEAGYLVSEKRRYENYAICGMGEKLASVFGIDLVFRSPTEYPDAILVNFENQKTLNVEFEEFSSDFRGHDPTKCDLIVCYSHNWKEKYPNERCPLPVYEIGDKEGKYYPKEE